MKITTVNFKAVLDPKKNFEAIQEILKKHSESDLVVFPEASIQGYMPFLEDESIKYYLESAIDLSKKDPIVTELQKAAQDNDQTIIVGGMERDDVHGLGHMFDTAFVFLPDGTVHTYRKTHLATNEPYFLFPGDVLEPIGTSVGKVGFLVCYDKCFSEAAKTLAVKGADIIVVVSAWAYSGVDQSAEEKSADHSAKVFDVYDQVRAVENQCLVVVANQVGVNENRSLEFLGHSKVVAPSGRILGELGDQEDALTVDINLQELLIEERVLNLSALNIMRNRRPDIYSD
ncbi:MAG: hypothetical protein RL097_492 [Candidatus Parcubacteria bacterium]|jgi:predicted amidohydrolase